MGAGQAGAVAGRPIPLLPAHALQTAAVIGQFGKSLELVAQASEPVEWLNTMEDLPF
jgi:hypothetical protein